MVANRSRSSGGAPTQLEQRAELLSALLRRYDADEEFNRELASLVPLAEAAVSAVGPSTERSRIDVQWLIDPESHGLSLDLHELASFDSAARSLAERFGLARLGEDGLGHILAWSDRYLSARTSGSPAPSTYGPGSLATVRRHYQFEPEVVGIVPAPWKEERWLPGSESRADARRRLSALANHTIERALTEIQRETEERGLIAYRRRVGNLDRDIDWLYRKMRFKATYDAIYHDLQPPPRGGVETVRKAIERAAKRLRVDTTGWEAGWRL